jgi:hypothetical protein
LLATFDVNEWLSLLSEKSIKGCYVGGVLAQSAFDPHAQRNAFRRRDARLRKSARAFGINGRKIKRHG